jgi:single-strand DNA-binding protein
MYSLNRAQILGNLTRDPEMRYTPNGQAVTSFAIATNRRWKDKDGNNQEQTEFHDIVAWGKIAEILSQYVHKGNKLYVEGHLQTRQWEAQDGAKKTRTEIIVEDFVFLSPKGEITANSGAELDSDVEESPVKEEKNTTKKPTKKEESSEEEINLDEIPF